MDISFEWNRQALLGMPAYEPLHSVISRLDEARFPGLQDCNALLAAHQPPITVDSGKPLRFVPQVSGKLAFEEQYEPRCYLKGEVQTRADNWHDLLNALVWFTFPKSKAAINTRHFRAMTRDDKAVPPGGRGAVRDTSTLLDECGVIVPFADEELAQLLRDFRWKELFWRRRARVQEKLGFYLFGHALYEKVLRPYVGMTGQGLLLPVEAEFFVWPLAQRLAHLDRQLADYLSAGERCRSTKELTPVPLLGVPGWCPENVQAEYYGNTAYFRPGRNGQGRA